MTEASRDGAIAEAHGMLASGRFRADLARRVAMRTVSADPARHDHLPPYLGDELQPVLERLGCTCRTFVPPDAPGPVLLGTRIEDPRLPTVLIYGHGDVVTGLDALWSDGLDPFTLTERDGRWYGRGTADNKGQHSINLAALEAVLAVCGRLGFNLKVLIEMGEECGSPGLAELVAAHVPDFAADMLIASDGPRIGLRRPTIFLGARGALDIQLEVVARDGYRHSGNWGGLLRNPGVELAHAIATLIGPTGECLLPELTPRAIPPEVRAALARCTMEPAPDDPAIDRWWGAPGLTPEERVFGWSTLEVMEIDCGNHAAPLDAIPPMARARLQLRHPVGVNIDEVLPAVRRRLDEAGLHRVRTAEPDDPAFPASRSDLHDPWVQFAAASIARTTGAPPAILPNLGGSLPNTIFSDTLGLPTIWVPHSYSGCGQHGGDEHMPMFLVHEGLAIMAGLFWDLGQGPATAG